ncbi:hypothetical protein M947_05865 [Sulfurimonas hongkongensis]|uniref:Uncharacterized protein n=1 Tax=Sulfurimonas hongkongensis TaxID=1172190 RepID=T0JRM6_9BACT|nr:hypothetical protein [Sulfurimonas hongkongensis]EQB39517.1 hypothetical protein M947_05865 [Sulfurimonas hongkongensis]
MNDLFIQNLLSCEDINALKEHKIEIGFLDEYGEGKTADDKIVQTLIFTCEEGMDYSDL